jgi:signal transduction histidine kinase
MPLSLADLFTLLDRVRSAAEMAGPPADQAASLAAALRTIWPAAAACRLDGPAGTVAAALDCAGRPAPDLATALRVALAGPAGDAVVGDIRMRVAVLEAGGRRHGALAAVVSPVDAPALVAVAHAAGESLDRIVQADETADRDWLADLGEVVGPVTHEFNNFLNTLMLQVAVMEMTAPDALKVELQGLKRQGRQAAGVIRLLQQYRRRKAGTASPADLSRAAAAAAAGDASLQLDLADGLPLVSGPATDLRRLCRFLLTGVSAISGGGTRVLMTKRDGDGVVLRLEVTGVTGGSLARSLDGPVGTEGTYGLELAACQSLVRRLGGAVRVEPMANGEAIVVELPAVG